MKAIGLLINQQVNFVNNVDNAAVCRKPLQQEELNWRTLEHEAISLQVICKVKEGHVNKLIG